MTDPRGTEMSLSAAIAAELHGEFLHAPGVTYDRLERTGISASTLKRHLTGKVAITFEVGEAVADALGLPMEEVLKRARLRQARPVAVILDAEPITTAEIADPAHDPAPPATPADGPQR